MVNLISTIAIFYINEVNNAAIAIPEGFTEAVLFNAGANNATITDDVNGTSTIIVPNAQFRIDKSNRCFGGHNGQTVNAGTTTIYGAYKS